MATSQNGYSANDRSVIASYDLPGGRVALRKGDVSVVLLWCATEWHRTVEPLVWPGIWGYAERTIRGSSTTLSNHASGTAIDCNAPQHPLGTAITANFSPAEIHAVRRLVAFCEGVVRWGGDYSGRKDGMHLEINANAAAVKRIADKIRAGVGPTIPAVSPNPVESSVSLTKTQAEQLNVVVQQLCGSNVPHEFPGWQTWPGGSVRADGKPDTFTVVDYLRKQNQRGEDTMRALNAIATAVAGIAPRASGSGPVALTDADVARIRDAVVPAVLNELSKRTAA